MRKKTVIAAAVLVSLILMFTVYRALTGGDPVPDDDEIMIRIQLDLREDIGLLIMGQDIDGVLASGGVSNADKTLIRKDDVLYWSISRSDFEGVGDEPDVKLDFSIVTEYCDPNYENIYPEELVIRANDITFKAAFGEMYYVTITGNNTDGYLAVLTEK